MARKPIHVEVLEEANGRVAVTTYSDGEIVRTLVDPNKKPKRKPRLRRQRMRIIDKTRKKRF